MHINQFKAYQERRCATKYTVSEVDRARIHHATVLQVNKYLHIGSIQFREIYSKLFYVYSKSAAGNSIRVSIL